MEDRLSSLPDEIITKILVHLDTKEVLRTGSLSKRWNSVWEFVPVFELCDDDFKIKGENSDGSSITEQNIKARLSKFVDRVLVARKSHRLEKISITTNQCVGGNIMISWMRAAIERRVSELVFNFLRQEDDDTLSELTPAMFASDYLTVLILRAFMTINIPTAASSFLPNLKFLELSFVVFRDDLSLPSLLSSCPNLEDLHIVRPRWLSTGTLYITSRSLKTLLVESTFEELENELKIISIDTPALEAIDISCETVTNFVVKELPCLVEAKLDLYGVSTTCLNMFLTRISHVKFLTLKPETTLALVLAGCGTLPLFPNLTRLNLHGVNHEYDRKHKNHTEWAVMLKILKCSPMLETLILQNYSGSFGEYDPMACWAVPHCLVSRLKTLEIDFSDYSEYDGRKLEYFLTKAKVLKTMTIRARSYPTRFIFISSFYGLLSPEIRNSVIWSDKQFIVTFPECNFVEPLKWEVNLTVIGKLRKCTPSCGEA